VKPICTGWVHACELLAPLEMSTERAQLWMEGNELGESEFEAPHPKNGMISLLVFGHI